MNLQQKNFSREQSNTLNSILQSCQQKIDPVKLSLAASETWSFRTVKDGSPQFDVAGGWSGQDIVPCFI